MSTITRFANLGCASLFLLCAIPVFSQQPVKFTVSLAERRQTIDNFGASGCWFSEGIGLHWPKQRKDSIARLLFSRSFNKNGAPEGIGLSAWRFNIGGGTAEQGESSGIKTAVKRVECFIDSAGNYDWTKQAGYVWFVRKAREYGVENLIAFSNTPPVHFTRNGRGFKTEKDYTCNLREDKYGDYASFLTKVLRHFEGQGLRFNYISPVNEPQWDWSNKPGEMNQEGTPWHNKDIFRITRVLDSTLQAAGLNTKILLPEAATLKHLYGERGHAANQIRSFYSEASPLNVKSFKTVHPIIAGHSYFTDHGDSNRIIIRRSVRDSAAAYRVPFWQSEYSMLGNGYKEGKTGRIPAMDCALFLAKMIHTDLTVANAAAWQLWNVYEPGSAAFDTRYYLIALSSNDSNTAGNFTITKNLWAFGHFSRFIRPGMTRINVLRSDGLSEEEASQDLMCSAYANAKGGVVLVLINYSEKAKTVDCSIPGKKTSGKARIYTTTGAADINMKPAWVSALSRIELMPRSINTIVIP
jgi:O-glycosyl hydrolase